jgi:putative transposase
MMAAMLTLILTGVFRVVRTHRALVLENLALRHQLAGLPRTARRPRRRRSDRVFWVLLARLGRGWAEAIAIVKPDTVIRWYRAGFRLVWTWKSRPHRSGRPAVAPAVRALICRMADGNPLWGAPRIHGKLRKLGLDISQAAVSKYLPRRRTPPSQTWRTLLANHVGSLVSVDFFTVSTVMFKVLFVCVVLAHERRRVVHVNVTATPTAQWTAQQLVEALPWETAPRYLLRDRDGVCGAMFSHRVHALGMHEVTIAPRAPWQNPYVERLIGTLRRECLDHVVVWNEDHLRRVLGACLAYYHQTKPGLTWPSTRTPPSPGRWSVPSGVASSRRPWSAASIIGTAAEPRRAPSGRLCRPRWRGRSAGSASRGQGLLASRLPRPGRPPMGREHPPPGLSSASDARQARPATVGGRFQFQGHPGTDKWKGQGDVVCVRPTAWFRQARFSGNRVLPPGELAE